MSDYDVHVKEVESDSDEEEGHGSLRCIQSTKSKKSASSETVMVPDRSRVRDKGWRFNDNSDD